MIAALVAHAHSQLAPRQDFECEDDLKPDCSIVNGTVVSQTSVGRFKIHKGGKKDHGRTIGLVIGLVRWVLLLVLFFSLFFVFFFPTEL